MRGTELGAFVAPKRLLVVLRIDRAAGDVLAKGYIAHNVSYLESRPSRELALGRRRQFGLVSRALGAKEQGGQHSKVLV